MTFLLPISILAQWEQEYEYQNFIQEKDTLPYRILYPENFSQDSNYPLVLFLHGAGERGNDNKKQLAHGASIFASKENRRNYPAIVVFPQCSSDSFWSNAGVDESKPRSERLVFKEGGTPQVPMELTLKLLDSLVSKSFVSKNKVYVAGLSMGGMGTFEILYRKPTLFAAAISICGGGNPKTVTEYADNTAVWVAHGAKDDVVNPHYSVEMVDAILGAGGYPRFTLYENANHNSWDSVFAESDFLSWLFSKQKN